MNTGHDGSLPEDMLSALRATAVLTGLPERGFFAKFTARKRRELVYRLQAQAPGLEIDVKVRGSGAMTAVVRMPCVMMDEGVVIQLGEAHSVAWAHSGEEAVLMSPLGHRHLEKYPEAGEVLDGFLASMKLTCSAVGAGGYRHWKSAMQLLTARIARERGCPVEVVAVPPMPADDGHDADARKGVTHVEAQDITDPEHPVRITGYEGDFAQIEDAMAPEAASIMLLSPGFVVRRASREIFHAG